MWKTLNQWWIAFKLTVIQTNWRWIAFKLTVIQTNCRTSSYRALDIKLLEAGLTCFSKLMWGVIFAACEMYCCWNDERTRLLSSSLRQRMEAALHSSLKCINGTLLQGAWEQACRGKEQEGHPESSVCQRQDQQANPGDDWELGHQQQRGCLWQDGREGERRASCFFFQGAAVLCEQEQEQEQAHLLLWWINSIRNNACSKEHAKLTRLLSSSTCLTHHWCHVKTILHCCSDNDVHVTEAPHSCCYLSLLMS